MPSVERNLPEGELKMAKPRTRAKLLGTVGVDSGRLLIADPCYNVQVETTGDERMVEGCGVEHPLYGHLALHFAVPGGDGIYPVYLAYDKEGRPESIVIDVSHN